MTERDVAARLESIETVPSLILTMETAEILALLNDAAAEIRTLRAAIAQVKGDAE